MLDKKNNTIRSVTSSIVSAGQAALSILMLRGTPVKFVIDGPRCCPKEKHDWHQTYLGPKQVFMTFKCKRCDSRMVSNKKPRALRKRRTASALADGEKLAE